MEIEVELRRQGRHKEVEQRRDNLGEQQAGVDTKLPMEGDEREG
jgi:hypothetical protein